VEKPFHICENEEEFHK